MNDRLAARLASGHVLITGAGGAVGRALTASLQAHGARTVLVERVVRGDQPSTHPSAASGAADLAKTLTVHAELSSPSSAALAVAEAEERMGPTTVLVNLAGGFEVDATDTTTSEDLEDMFNRNLRSAVNATAAVLPGMLQRQDGAIVAIGAGAALAPAPGRKAYAASKAALTAFFTSLAVEVAPGGISASVLHPMGTIDTPANRRAMPQADTSRWIGLDAVCEAVLFLAAGHPGGSVRELKLFGA